MSFTIALTDALFAVINTTAAKWREDKVGTEIEIAAFVMSALARVCSNAIAKMAEQCGDEEGARKAMVGLHSDQVETVSKSMLIELMEAKDGNQMPGSPRC